MRKQVCSEDFDSHLSAADTICQNRKYILYEFHRNINDIK